MPIATICECIEGCFAYFVFCEEFAPLLTEEDRLIGAQQDIDLIAYSTLLMSSISLRKLDDLFLEGGWKDDLKANQYKIDTKELLGGKSFLENDTEREQINKCAAHLTTKLSLEQDFEVILREILSRSLPVFQRLIAALRKADTDGSATHYLDKAENTLHRAENRLRSEDAPESTIAPALDPSMQAG